MTLDTTTSLSCLILGRPVVIAAPDLEARTAVAAIFRGFATPCQLTEAARYRIVSSRRRGWLVEAHSRPTFSGAGLLDALLAL